LAKLAPVTAEYFPQVILSSEDVRGRDDIAVGDNGVVVGDDLCELTRRPTRDRKN